MAKKTRARRCFYCERRFRNAQAVRAHQLHCEVRRMRAQAEAEITVQPAGRSSRTKASHVNTTEASQSLHKRHGPDSQENKLRLLNTHEAIMQLWRTAGHHAWMAQWLARVDPSHAEGHASSAEWFGVNQDLGDIERDLSQMVGVLRLDRTQLFRIYHRFQVARENWLHYLWRDFSRNGELTPEGAAAVYKDDERLTDVLSNIKCLLVASR